jgi:peptidoglycan/xylan/chitin deacetylase (PgdA/CDA1 family)
MEIELPVLLYHRVGPVGADARTHLFITPTQFERQVRWMARHGYTGIAPSDWFAFVRNGKELPERPVLVTFDDGYADTARFALGVLVEHGFRAAVFTVTDSIGRSNVWKIGGRATSYAMMTAEQISYWFARGIEFGAHTCTHRDLTKLDSSAATAEAVASAERLQEVLGVPTVSFAYPYGSYNPETVAIVRKHFQLAFTVDIGLNNRATDLHQLRRAMVRPAESMIEFQCHLKLGCNPKHELRRVAGDMVRRYAGTRR